MPTLPRHPRAIGCEILRRVKQWEVPEHPLDPLTERAVLGTHDDKYLVPPGIDVLELGVIGTAGNYALLPIDGDGKPLWDEAIDFAVTEVEAARQREILLGSYRVLCAIIREANELESSVEEHSGRGTAHPVFGLLRLATIEVWKALRRGTGPLAENELNALRLKVARQVAAKIRAHFIG